MQLRSSVEATSEPYLSYHRQEGEIYGYTQIEDEIPLKLNMYRKKYTYLGEMIRASFWMAAAPSRVMMGRVLTMATEKLS